MRSWAALLAAVLVATPFAGCDDDGAEPGASEEATLVLDFQPNAVHTGIYSALHRGYFEDEGIDLEVREPSASTDAPKLLEAGRADFAVMDIHDLGIARERDLDVVGVMPIVQRPLAAVIAADRDEIRSPAELDGGTVGVTGLPSDDAVLDSLLTATGTNPASVERVTIGFDSIAAISAGRVDGATSFWNAEGVALKRRGVPIRIFRVDDYGAPRYPELVLVTARATLAGEPSLVDSVVQATKRGYVLAAADPESVLEDLVDENEGLDLGEQRDQLTALNDAAAFLPVGRFDVRRLAKWAEWDAAYGIVEQPPTLNRAFDLSRASPAGQLLEGDE